MRGARGFALALACCALLLAVRSDAVDLVGTWHVLVHYKDAATTHPDRERWTDKVWSIEMEGSRLKWTEYPIVVFSDQSGRFEQGEGGRMARVLHYWEPNPGQQSQIDEGLEINPRGSRTKTLRGAHDAGWSSATKRGYRSARFITYTETWTIDDPAGLPVFTFDDVMGSASTESFDGRTRYTATSVSPDERVIEGTYDRDGARIGTFRMTRAGETRVVEGSGVSQGERVYQSLFGAVAGSALYRGELPGGMSEADVRKAIEAGEFSDEDRAALRKGFEDGIRAAMKAADNDTRRFQGQIQNMARQMEKAFVEDGKSVAEIQEMLRNGEIRP